MDAQSNLLSEIREVNLSYLLLAQRMLHEDKATAMFRLGFSSEVADIISSLTLAQTVKLASTSTLLCRFRFNEAALLSALNHSALGSAVQRAHTTLLLANQPVEQID